MKRNRRLLENCTEWNDRSLSCKGDRNARSFLSAVERQTCNSNQLLWSEPGTHLCSRILEVVYTVHCNSDWDSGHSRKKMSIEGQDKGECSFSCILVIFTQSQISEQSLRFDEALLQLLISIACENAFL